MINIKQQKYLEEKYQLNIYQDILLSSKNDYVFVIDLNEIPNNMYVLSGELKNISLPDVDVININDLLQYVETDNSFAEVEGKHNFIESLRIKFRSFDEQLYLYIPIKRDKKPLWLYLGFKRLNKYNLVLGRVLRVYEQTPTSIIHYQKTYQDALTRLFTRETLQLHINNLKKTEDTYLMYLDIDGFKQINDQYGHQVGDQFLIDISKLFISNWERNVIYYRLSGDEFAIYCFDHSEEEIIKRAKKIINDIENLNEIAKEFKISVSIGIVELTNENKDYHQLLNLGDKLMYQAKKQGPGNFVLKTNKGSGIIEKE